MSVAANSAPSHRKIAPPKDVPFFCFSFVFPFIAFLQVCSYILRKGEKEIGRLRIQRPHYDNRALWLRGELSDEDMIPVDL